MNKVQIGLQMEKLFIPELEKLFDDVTHIGGLSPYDFLCGLDGITYGINLKYSVYNYTISLRNIMRLRNEYPSIIPAFIFFDGDYYYFFEMKAHFSNLPKKGTLVLKRTTFLLDIESDILNLLNEEAKKRGVSRNLLIVQIIRKHFNLPSLLKESG